MRTIGSLSKPAPGCPVAVGHPLADSLVESFLLSEGGGLRAVGSVRAITGTLTNTPTWVAAPHGPALSFTSGSSQYVTMGDQSSLTALTSFSVEVWVRATAAPGANETIVSKGSLNASAPGYSIYREVTTGNISGQIRSAAAFNIPASATAINDSKWHQCLLTWDDGAKLGTIYLDGLAKNTNATSVTLANTTEPFLIGARAVSGTPGLFFTGRVSLARFWKRCLRPNEAQWLYVEPFAMYLPRPVSRTDAGATFQAAWARSANRLIGGGVWTGG